MIQFNVAGHPVLHKETSWPFDPDLGERRARANQEKDGYLSERAIEFVGLGIDGRQAERLVVQRERDALIHALH